MLARIEIAYCKERHLVLLEGQREKQGRHQQGASDASPPCEIGAPHFTFGPRLLHASNTLFLKCGPSFWFLAPPVFWPPLLLNRRVWWEGRV